MFGFSRKTTSAAELSEDDLIKRTSEALSFDGFNAVKIQQIISERIPLRDLIVLLTAYVMTGNSLAKRLQSGKISERTVGESILNLMKSYKILLVAKKADDLTLSRIAISLPALLIAVRHRIKPVARIVTTTPWHLQDLALNGYAETVAASGCDNFVQGFSKILNEASNKGKTAEKQTKEADAIAKVLAYRELAKVNLKNDTVNVKLMSALVEEKTSIQFIAKEYKITVRVATPSAVVEKPRLEFIAPVVAEPIETTEEEETDLTGPGSGA